MTARPADPAAEGSAAHDAAPRPLLTVVRGEPTPEQLAALIAVVSARAAGGSEDSEPVPPSLWSRPQLRGSLSYGAGAWRASSLPG